MMPIKRDTITLVFVVIAVMISLYLSTYEKGFISLFPVVLLLSGIGLLQYTKGSLPPPEDGMFTKKTYDIFFFTIIALFGIGLGAILGQAALVPKVLGVAGWDLKMYGVLMAVAEEVFFRGFVTNFLLLKMPSPMIAIMCSGGIFTIFHMAVYETSFSALLYVLVAGVILAFVAYKSQRLSPCILAHATLNFVVV